MRLRWTTIAVMFVVLAALGRGARAPAHPGNAATALAKVDAHGSFELILRFDILSFVLDENPDNVVDGQKLELLATADERLTELLAQARERFAGMFQLYAGDEAVALALEAFPTTADVRAWAAEHPRHPLPMKLDARVRARLPAGARALSVRFPETVGDVILTIELPAGEPVAFPLRPGERSPDVPVTVAAAPANGGDGTAAHFDVPDQAGDAPEGAVATGAQAAAGDGPGRAPMSRAAALWRYVQLGFTHIVPHGLDHVLFVLGLFLLSQKAKPLLLQVTAFTVAHSITLGLSMLGVVELPARVVEPLIAASIAFVAIENVLTTRLHAWRTAVVFAFGLVHGLGFAGVLREAGLPRNQLATALVGFNVGVELGQLTVIAFGFLAVGWWSRKTWYRRRIVIPASAGIAAVGAFWTVQRLL